MTVTLAPLRKAEQIRADETGNRPQTLHLDAFACDLDFANDASTWGDRRAPFLVRRSPRPAAQLDDLIAMTALLTEVTDAARTVVVRRRRVVRVRLVWFGPAGLGGCGGVRWRCGGRGLGRGCAGVGASWRCAGRGGRVAGEGSTRRWEADADATRAALVVHDKVLRTAIETHGGWLFKHTGDGVCTAFASPRSAVDAAVAAQLQLELPVRKSSSPIPAPT
jgi:hypothetical protein